MNKQMFNPVAVAQAGVSGAVIMAISMPLSAVIGVVPGIVALAVSCLYGLQTFLHGDIPILQRLILFPIVSLTIFASSSGVNTAITPNGESLQVPAIISEAQGDDGTVLLGGGNGLFTIRPYFPERE